MILTCQFCKLNYLNNNDFRIHLKQHKDFLNFINKYIKYNLNDIEFINNVPKVVFVCWFGGYGDNIPLMSENRFEAFKLLLKNIKIPVILITNINYKSFILVNYPIHKSFDLLSGVHKSDYLRCYLLLHYGGGYHDIKARIISWENEWNKDDWLFDNNIWMYGRQEKNKNSIGYPPGNKHIRINYKKLITMGWIICKKQSEFLIKLMEQINFILDKTYNDLIKFPGLKAEGYYFENPFLMVPKNSYPLRWLQILGEIYHPLMLNYTKHIKFGLPDALKNKKYK